VTRTKLTSSKTPYTNFIRSDFRILLNPSRHS
jgi:hypothetical protein